MTETIIKDEVFMQEAIRLSKLAVLHGNEPFGAVLVKQDPTFHAEIGLIRRFCMETGQKDLRGYTLYSSCEPCFMCSGAMVWTKLGRLVYAASNIDLEKILHKKGSNCSQIVFEHSNWKPEVTAGVLREDALQVLRAYFEKEQK